MMREWICERLQHQVGQWRHGLPGAMIWVCCCRRSLRDPEVWPPFPVSSTTTVTTFLENVTLTRSG